MTNRMLAFGLILIMVAPLASRATGPAESTAVSPDSTVTNTVELPAGWDELRDPLWPIGYTPPPPTTAPTAPSATNRYAGCSGKVSCKKSAGLRLSATTVSGH